METLEIIQDLEGYIPSDITCDYIEVEQEFTNEQIEYLKSL